jgi:uncharacterized protein (TIGR02646 family)
MISNNREKDFTIPKRLVDAKAKWEYIAKTGDKKAINDAIYKGEKTVKGEKQYTVRETLKEIYHNKCAYCEIIDHKPEVEHYRPKKSVKEDKSHLGYYWLCYEWTNLIPSCHYCNTDGGKGTQFPIMGIRVTTPDFENGILDKEKCKAENSPLIDEQPYLFHPEIDKPETAFEFKKNGAIRGIDHLGRGRQTVKICNLNRENLIYRRQKIIDSYRNKIKKTLNDYLKGEITTKKLKVDLLHFFLEIQVNSKIDKEFSLVSKYIQDSFDSIIPPLLPTPKQQLIAKRAYRQFKNKTLLKGSN